VFHSQRVDLHFDRARESYSKAKSYPHHATMHITLESGTPKEVDLTNLLDAGSCVLFASSTPTSADPYVPNKFTVQLDGGDVLQVDDMILLNLSTRPDLVVFATAAGATADVDLIIQLAGQ